MPKMFKPRRLGVYYKMLIKEHKDFIIEMYDKLSEVISNNKEYRKNISILNDIV